MTRVEAMARAMCEVAGENPEGEQTITLNTVVGSREGTAPATARVPHKCKPNWHYNVASAAALLSAFDRVNQSSPRETK